MLLLISLSSGRYKNHLGLTYSKNKTIPACGVFSAHVGRGINRRRGARGWFGEGFALPKTHLSPKNHLEPHLFEDYNKITGSFRYIAT
jgi:hypothetical protein